MLLTAYPQRLPSGIKMLTNQLFLFCLHHVAALAHHHIIDLLQQFADMKDSTSAQISLAWMLHKYPNVVPIPGSKNKERIIENLNASEVTLTEEEFRSLEESLNKCRVYGHRGFNR